MFHYEKYELPLLTMPTPVSTFLDYFTYLITYFLIPCSRVILEKPVKKFPAF